MPSVLITGANRGIGLALTKAYAEKGYKVVAAVRDPRKMEAVNGVLVVKLDQGSLGDAKEAISELKSKHGIDRLDLVICNAAINVTHSTLAELSMDDLEITWKTNVRGPLVLFQATLPLQPEGSKFVVISSGTGTIGQKHRVGGGVYGQSKASVNYMVSALIKVAKLHAEHPELVILSLNPGWVETEMGLQGAKWNGLDDTPQRLEDTLPGMIKVIDDAKKDTTSGLMVNYDGKQMAW